MPIPGHSIVPVVSSDLSTVANLLHSCKLALTINRLLFKDWPNEAAQKPLYANAVQGGFNNPSVENLKMVDDESGELVGYIALSRKRPEIAKQPTDGENEGGTGDGKPELPEGLDPDVYAAVAEAATKINKDIEGIDHFELTYVLVKSSSRRRGIGSELVRVCLERAKAEGIPLILGSEPAAHDFFVKLGFTDTKHIDFDLAKWAPRYSGFGVFRLAGMIWSH